jgi:hypothetical protein
MSFLRMKRTRTRFSPSVDESELREQSLALTMHYYVHKQMCTTKYANSDDELLNKQLS